MYYSIPDIIMSVNNACPPYLWAGGITAVCLLCLALLWLLKWRYSRLAARYANWQTEAQRVETATHTGLYQQPFSQKEPPYPYVSIVIPSCDNAHELEYLLPRLTRQSYEGRFEIIVADQLALEDTRDVTIRCSTPEHPVRYTRVPTTSRQIELRKLAVTLGIKAAHGEWAIVIDPHTVPENDQWLHHYGQNLNADTDLVMAYYNYYDEGTLRARRAILDRVNALNQRLEAYEWGLIMGCEHSNYAVRRQWFVEQKGFADSLTLPFGEETIFAYLHARADRCTVLCSPDTKLTEYLPDVDTLQQRRLYYAEAMYRISRIRPYNYEHSSLRLTRCLCWRRWRTLVCTLILTTCCLTWLAYVGLRVATDLMAETYSQTLAPCDVLMLAALVLGIWLPIYALRKSLRALNERHFGLYVIYYDLVQPLRLWFTGFRCFVRRGSLGMRRFA